MAPAVPATSYARCSGIFIVSGMPVPIIIPPNCTVMKSTAKSSAVSQMRWITLTQQLVIDPVRRFIGSRGADPAREREP